MYSKAVLTTFATVLLLGRICPAVGQVITHFEPPFGSTGEQVIISGTGFAAGNLEVRFGGPSGAVDTTARATSDMTIFAKVPSGAVTGPIHLKVGTKTYTTLEDFLVLGRGPFLTGFAPAYGAVNDTVIIYGWHLTNTTAVKFGGKAATSIMPNAAGSQITTRVPSGATNGPITVTTIYGTSNTPAPFTVIGAGPFIASFFPPIVTPGGTVSVEGAHFTGVTDVSFNGKPGRNLFVQSDILLRVDAPPDVANGYLSVSSPLGRHTNSQMYFVPPVITSFSPTQAVADVNLNIRGSNFLGALSVTIGGANAQIQAVNNTNLSVVIPEGGRSGPVRVNTPAGAVLTTNNFRYLPVITSFTPNAGPAGTTVTINGRNLDEGLQSVRFGEASTSTNIIVSAQQIQTKVPANAVSSRLTLTTTNGSAFSDGFFHLPPALTRASSSNAAPGSVVTLFGANLLDTTNVSFNGTPATFVPPVTNSQLSVTVPSGFITGAIRVGTPGGEALIGPFYGAPLITGFTPTHGLPGVQVTLTGTNFLGVTAVKVGGISVPQFTIHTNGEVVTLIIPTNAASGPLAVTGPAGTVASTAPFTLDFFSDLTLTMQAAPSSTFVGSNIVYDLEVANLGPAAAPNVVITDTLPENVTLRSNRVSQGTVSINGRTVTASLGVVPTSHTASLQLFITPNTLGTLQNTASIQSDYSDPDPANNSASVSLVVLPLPVLKIDAYSEEQWRVSWPLALSNFTLQIAPQPLPGSTWSNLTTTPMVSGTNKFVIEPASKPSRFYRLHGSP
jgi:uncharacterized repeat protein (TIGR01451 family)